MFMAAYQKPDGRKLWLYSRRPIELRGPVTVPDTARVVPSSHLRWHPIEREWVIYAAHRQERPVTAGAGAANPLAPCSDQLRPTELPAGNWEVAVFDNRFPSLAADPGPTPAIEGVLTTPAHGRAEVVVFGQDEGTPLGRLDDDRIAMVLAVVGARTRALAAEGARYILAFENRGVEMGVTLHHPHGQIYAYGFMPGRIARAQNALAAHYEENGTDLMSVLCAATLENEERLIDRRAHAVSFVPPFARFPFEIWIVPLVHAPDLSSLSDAALGDVASVLGSALRRLDGLWRRPMPYLMTINQAPCDGASHPEWTLRIEIWPLRRTADKLKFLAGTELGAGVFASDVLPETAAAALKAAQP